eukprot:gene19240-25091_t
MKNKQTVESLIDDNSDSDYEALCSVSSINDSDSTVSDDNLTNLNPIVDESISDDSTNSSNSLEGLNIPDNISEIETISDKQDDTESISDCETETDNSSKSIYWSKAEIECVLSESEKGSLPQYACDNRLSSVWNVKVMLLSNKQSSYYDAEFSSGDLIYITSNSWERPLLGVVQGWDPDEISLNGYLNISTRKRSNSALSADSSEQPQKIDNINILICVTDSDHDISRESIGGWATPGMIINGLSISLTILGNTLTFIRESQALVSLHPNILLLQGPPGTGKTHTILGIIGALLTGAGSQALIEVVIGKTGFKFDAIIIDEAAQSTEPSALIPFKFDPHLVIMVGDPCQLPAVILSKKSKECNYHQSLFERLQKSGVEMTMLNTQYRMHPYIADYSSYRFYNNQLITDSSLLEKPERVRPYYFHPSEKFKPFVFHNVMKDNIGIIAPYSAQRKLLKQIFKERFGYKCNVEISTIDGFQGREKDIIFFSCVRAPNKSYRNEKNMDNSIGFLKEKQRLNVAITRARNALWIVGHADTLSGDSEWEQLLNYMKTRKYIYRVFKEYNDKKSHNNNTSSKTS